MIVSEAISLCLSYAMTVRFGVSDRPVIGVGFDRISQRLLYIQQCSGVSFALCVFAHVL